MEENHLLAISPLDGRYSGKVEHLSQYFSEAALMRYRILVEIEWFIHLFNNVKLKGTKSLKPIELKILRSIYEKFDVVAAKRVKDIEKITNHDVKACEYYIKEQIKNGPIEKYQEFVHFTCTSEDINNLSYGCMIRDFLEREYMPILSAVVQEMYFMAMNYKDLPMLARTHGQPASPTTLGKELINFVARLETEMEFLTCSKFLMGKINGAVGNYNAHGVSYPEVNWVVQTKEFVESLGLEFNQYTTQIEPHDCYARVFDSVRRINNILLDFDRDMWGYISLAYFKQKTVIGEVGSSTMPHKVNPIDFENSEGNLGVANALLEHMSNKLPISRFQRDLTDSTVLRNVGSALTYCILAYRSLSSGLPKCEVNKKVIQSDLADKWEVLAEPIQMVMRKYMLKNPYEQLKNLTRGKGGVTKSTIQSFINKLKIPAPDKKRLLVLTPETYVGLAEKLVDDYKPKSSFGGGCNSMSCEMCSGCH